MPAGKAEIISHRGWRLSTSRLCALELELEQAKHKRPPFDVYSKADREARVAQLSKQLAEAPRARVSYGINVRSLLAFALPDNKPLSKKDIRSFRQALRDGVKF